MSADGRGAKFLCWCYFQRNIFLHKYNLHVTYNNNNNNNNNEGGEHAFWEQYGGVLAERGCRDVTQRNQVIETITKEVHCSLTVVEIISCIYTEDELTVYFLSDSVSGPLPGTIPTGSDQIWPNLPKIQIRPNPTESDQIRPSQTKSDRIYQYSK